MSSVSSTASGKVNPWQTPPSRDVPAGCTTFYMRGPPNRSLAARYMRARLSCGRGATRSGVNADLKFDPLIKRLFQGPVTHRLPAGIGNLKAAEVASAFAEADFRYARGGT